ncbi:MAG: CDP-glycerol glycerophosphotransferase family protein [Promethearchaeota archaeon]
MIRLRRKINKLVNFILDDISKKIGFNIRHLIAYIISKLYSNKIDENLLIFGSTSGKAFLGNSKYLFLYLNQNSKYNCIWITSSTKVLKHLRDKNYNVILNRDLFKTIKALKAAKYIFVTHGFGDILMIDFSPKTKLIRLDHGITLKRLRSFTSDSNLSFFKRKMRQKLVQSTSFYVITSEEDKKTKKLSFPLPNNKYIDTGYPRNDILINFTREQYLDIKNSLGLTEGYEVILYAPTHRRYEHKNPLNKRFCEKLDELLINEKKILLYKPHPVEDQIDLSLYNNIKSVNPKVDIMDLLVISDILITDYSSVFFDFLVTMRPIIFFSYDLEKYLMMRGTYFDYETFVPGPIVRTGDELLSKLKNINHWASQYERERKRMREWLNKYSDGNSSKKLIKFLKLKLN